MYNNNQDFDNLDQSFEYNSEEIFPEIDRKDNEYTINEIYKLYFINNENNVQKPINSKDNTKTPNIENTRTL